jgi:peptidoglycan hydrolase CwlO-like protein
MRNIIKKIVLSLGFVAFAMFFLSSAIADTMPDVSADLTAVQDQRVRLQKELQDVEAQITQYQKDLKNVQSEKNTLSNKLKQLANQQASIRLQIKATSLRLEDLNIQIFVNNALVKDNREKIENIKDQIGKILNAIYQRDNFSLLRIVLTREKFSDIMSDVKDLSQITASLSGLLDEVNKMNIALEKEQADLADQQDEVEKFLSIQDLQNQQLGISVLEQNNLLQKTKGKESNYQASLTGAQKQAQEIRNSLYQLLQTSEKITFGQAVQIAQWAEKQTGVRAAFILAILTQESNLGKNVGTCNRAGDPPSKSWKVVMNPTRDQPHFKKITEELGRNPDITPISCPMHGKDGKQIGWGGAMGPAQFIPSTWIGYRDKVSAITGKSADPWDIRDAFLASAIKLGADGAKTVDGEWAAAMRYFSGSTNPKYSFYGDSVVSMALKYQEDIKAIGN